jgi:rhamnopyranosyl-N-acetylglucosaminyl-diphospho-decaprenol beta-1,3/1,4-galactofuranosyltransferase
MNLHTSAAGLTEVPVAVSPDRMRLVALVVTYNRQAQLRVTVARLLAEDVDALIVVDNASTDGSGAYLRQITDPRLHVMTLAENTGGAGGFEHGLREATRLFDPDWCVLMDDDARPEPGAMSRFLAGARGLERGGYEAVAGGVFYPDGHICEMNRPSRNPFWHLKDFLNTVIGGGRGGFHVSDADYNATTPKPIDATSFIGFFLSRQAIARGGYPDGRLFIYADDVLYTLKLSRSGGVIGFAPWLRFEHDCSTYTRGERRIHHPIWKVYYTYRNALLAYREASGPIFFWFVLAIVLVKWHLKARHAGPDRAAYLTLLHLALGDALRNRLNRTQAEIHRIAQRSK